MDTQRLYVEPAKARELWRAYQTHLHYSTPVDDEVRRAYQLLAQGKLIIRAISSVTAAGLSEEGFPKLALCRADKKAVRCDIANDGSAMMRAEGTNVPYRGEKQNSCLIRWPSGSFPGGTTRYGGRAAMPMIPVMHRPKRGLANYHVLWEAEWARIPPRDPYLLRRIGRADMWLVVAMWDLTEIERAALAPRM